MSAKLVMGSGLSLPLEAVTDKLAFLGRTGTGKTYAAQKAAEEMHRVGAQFVALDPVGKWWSLRLAADGKAPGIPVPVFGGLQGDLPLEPTAGKQMADLVCDRGISVVLDVSQFEYDTHKNRFAREFGERLFFRKKAVPSALHLFLEEAQEFVPQNLSGDDDKKVLHAFTRLWKLGRNFGIGGSLLTQRPQEVNKKVLNLTEVLFAFQLNGTHERKAVAEWIKDKSIDIDVDAILPKLQEGEPHVWSPVLLGISKTVKIGAKWTFDASSTPKVGARAVEVKPLAPIDLERIKKEMAATVERAKAEDPKELRKEIGSLRQQLTVAQKAGQRVAAPTVERVEVKVPVLEPGLLHRLEEASDALLSALAEARAVYQEIQQALDAARQLAAQRPAPARPALAARPVQARPSPPRSARPVTDTSDMGKGERVILSAIAQYPDGVSREQLTVLTGYKRSSRDTYLQKLGAKGYAEVGLTITATEAGVKALGDDYEPLPTGDALREWWMDRLPQGERRVLEEVVRVFPRPIGRDELSTATGYQRSSRDTYLQRLKSRRLVDVERAGIIASEQLFS